jgi:hypothetical protein
MRRASGGSTRAAGCVPASTHRAVRGLLAVLAVWNLSATARAQMPVAVDTVTLTLSNASCCVCPETVAVNMSVRTGNAAGQLVYRFVGNTPLSQRGWLSWGPLPAHYNGTTRWVLALPPGSYQLAAQTASPLPRPSREPISILYQSPASVFTVRCGYRVLPVAPVRSDTTYRIPGIAPAPVQPPEGPPGLPD